MAAPKPCLGYPSRSAAVMALRAEGKSTKAIARLIGIPETTVSALEHSAKRTRRHTRPAETNGRTVVVPLDILRRLAEPAQQRRISVNELARRILDAAADDNLADAILDDRGATQAG